MVVLERKGEMTLGLSGGRCFVVDYYFRLVVVLGESSVVGNYASLLVFGMTCLRTGGEEIYVNQLGEVLQDWVERC